MLFGFALLSLTTAALASLFVREDETPAEQRDAAFESHALRELRALASGSTGWSGRPRRRIGPTVRRPRPHSRERLRPL